MVRWYRRHWGLKNAAQPKTPGSSSNNPGAVPFPAFDPLLLSALPSIPYKLPRLTPRHKQIEHVYSSLYWPFKLKNLVDSQTKIDKALANASDGPGWKNWAPVVTQQRVTHECWEAESDEVKKIVEAKREALYQADLAIWNDRNEELQSPEKQQVYVFFSTSLSFISIICCLQGS
jgi:hypothetical protein